MTPQSTYLVFDMSPDAQRPNISHISQSRGLELLRIGIVWIKNISMISYHNFITGLKDPGIVREYDPNCGMKEEGEQFEYPILGRNDELSAMRKLMTSYIDSRER